MISNAFKKLIAKTHSETTPEAHKKYENMRVRSIIDTGEVLTIHYQKNMAWTTPYLHLNTTETGENM